jgi:large subunit ribosomal protein L13
LAATIAARIIARFPGADGLTGLRTDITDRPQRIEADCGMATYTPKASEIQREWHVVDAEGMVLGRLCTEVARILRGKHKPTFAPHIDTGDHVIIVNADKIVMTAGKADRTMVYRHSGYPGGIKSETYAHLHARKPEEALRKSVRGMLPKGPLGRQQILKLQVYAGPTHPHAAQTPVKLEIPAAKAR